ncbi:MAG: hypothetical protein ABR601_02520 [Parasphingopyxis sp.]
MSVIRSLGRLTLGRTVANKVAGRGLLGAGVGLVATRLALRSLPGAALVGGGLFAKHLWDRRREKQAAHEEMSPEDAEMGIARAEGEPDIAEGAMPGDGVAAVASAG